MLTDEWGMSDCVKCMRGDASGRYSGLVLYLDLYNFRPVRVNTEDGLTVFTCLVRCMVPLIK